MPTVQPCVAANRARPGGLTGGWYRVASVFFAGVRGHALHLHHRIAQPRRSSANRGPRRVVISVHSAEMRMVAPEAADLYACLSGALNCPSAVLLGVGVLPARPRFAGIASGVY